MDGRTTETDGREDEQMDGRTLLIQVPGRGLRLAIIGSYLLAFVALELSDADAFPLEGVQIGTDAAVAAGHVLRFARQGPRHLH